jgi:imidazolonepropionase-like amidohydrolase
MRTGRAILGTLCGAALAAGATAQDLAVRGDLVHTMAGPPLRDGVVLVTDGRISAVGPADEVRVPEGVEVLSAAVVTPGLVDAHSVVGLAGWLNHPHDSDEHDDTDPLQPELRAIDAYNPREPLVEYLRGYGITTLHTGHAPLSVISGQTMIVKTRGETVDEAVVVPFAMVAATLGTRSLREGESPGTRSKAVALLRQELLKARARLAKQEAAEEGDAPEPDLRLDALGAVLRREVPLLVTAHRAVDLLTALRVAEEFDLSVVLDGAAEVYDVIEPVREAGVPVFLHPTMQFGTGERENLSMETAARLREAGIPFALQSCYEDYVPKTRVVLFEAALAASYGLDVQAALGAITIDAARILGIDARVGSLEVGKDADLALYDGDPFEYTSHCVGVVIEGEIVSSEPR